VGCQACGPVQRLRLRNTVARDDATERNIRVGERASFIKNQGVDLGQGLQGLMPV